MGSMTSRRRTHRKRRRPVGAVSFTLVLAVAAALLLGVGGLRLVGGPPAAAPVAQSAEASAASPTADATAAAQDRATAAVAQALATAGATAQGAVSVAVLDLDSGVGATSGGAGHPFVTASIVKADILAVLLRQSDSVLTAEQQTEAVAMIEQSDNDAAGALYEDIGGADGLDEANRTFGLTGTTAGRDGYWGLTTTTSEDQLRLLRVIFGDDSPLDGTAQAYLRKLMGRISTDQDWGVSAAADEADGSDNSGGDGDDGGWMLKNGWLSRSADGLWAINSIGQVTHDGRNVLVAVLSDGNGTEQSGISLVESVAVAAVDALAAVSPN